MKNKKATVGKTKIESKDYVDLGVRPVSELSKLNNDLHFWARLEFYFSLIISVFSSLLVAIGSIKAFSLLSSDLPQIPQAYVYLIGSVISSIVGISVTFLLGRFIDKRHEVEREEVIERVRSKEKELFKMFDLDFDSITKRRELDAGQTV